MPETTTHGAMDLYAIYENEYSLDDDGNQTLQTAHVRQEVTREWEYRHEGGFATTKKSRSGFRYAFVNMPIGMSEDDIKEAIRGAKVQRILGCRPTSVMSEGQLGYLSSLEGAAAKEYLTDFENRAVIMNPETEEYPLYQGEYVQFGRNKVIHPSEAADQPSVVDYRPEDFAVLQELDENTEEVGDQAEHAELEAKAGDTLDGEPIAEENPVATSQDKVEA